MSLDEVLLLVCEERVEDPSLEVRTRKKMLKRRRRRGIWRGSVRNG